MSNESVGFNRKQIAIIFKIAFLEAMALSIILPSVVSTGEITVGTILPSTFVIQVGGLNTYNAFRTGGSASLPQYSESNITKLIHDDIEHGVFCVNGCSTTVNPGSYNVTQSIIIDKNSFSITGSPATDFIPQRVSFSCCGISSAPRILFVINASNFIANGFKVDDNLRVNQANINGELFNAELMGTNCFLQQLTLWNASHAAIDITGNNCIINQNTIYQSKISTGTNLEGINIALGSIGTRIIQNTIWYWNSSVGTTGIRLNSGATATQIAENDIEFNSFGIVSALFGHSITIENNAAISNNFAAGIILSTPTFGTGSGGPVTIVGNSILDNSKDVGTVSQCANSKCPGIMITGTRPMWDTVTITGNTIKDDQTIPTQQNAIWLNSVQYSNLTVIGNALGREATTTIIKFGVNSLSSWIISENPGWNPQPTTLNTAGASPFTSTNTIADKEQEILSTANGISAFSCSISGMTITLPIISGTISPILNSADSCTYTWTVTAPTFYITHQ